MNIDSIKKLLYPLSTSKNFDSRRLGVKFFEHLQSH